MKAASYRRLPGRLSVTLYTVLDPSRHIVLVTSDKEEALASLGTRNQMTFEEWMPIPGSYIEQEAKP